MKYLPCPILQPMKINIHTSAGLGKNLNSNLSFGQAALTFCLPGATFCWSSLLIYLEDDLLRPLPMGPVNLKVTCPEENLLVPDDWMGLFSSPGGGACQILVLLCSLVVLNPSSPNIHIQIILLREFDKNSKHIQSWTYRVK